MLEHEATMKTSWRVLMKNRILKAITVVNVLIFVVSASAIDSPSYVPYAGLLLSMLWLIPFAIANNAFPTDC